MQRKHTTRRDPATIRDIEPQILHNDGDDWEGGWFCNEEPRMFNMSMAAILGLEEAVFVNQLHYWIRRGHRKPDGFLWVYNSIDAWHEQYPCWTWDQLYRIVRRLELPYVPTKFDVRHKRGPVVISTDKWNYAKSDRTKWYRLDYAELKRLRGLVPETSRNREMP